MVASLSSEKRSIPSHLRDRFGLTVRLADVQPREVRLKIAQRRRKFAAAPAAFLDRYEADQRILRAKITAAQHRLKHVEVEEEIESLIADICHTFQLEGVRGDLALYHTAVAIAALESAEEEPEVTGSHVQRAAALVLPHRRDPAKVSDDDPAKLLQLVQQYNEGKAAREAAKETEEQA